VVTRWKYDFAPLAFVSSKEKYFGIEQRIVRPSPAAARLTTRQRFLALRIFPARRSAVHAPI